MGAATGGRHIAMVVITIPTRERTAGPITEAMAIIILRLTMTLRPVLMAGNRRLMAHTDRQQEGPVTILIPERTLEAPRYRRLTGAEAQRRPIIRTPVPMLRPGKVRARMLSGVAPTSPEETKARPRVITQARTER